MYSLNPTPTVSVFANGWWRGFLFRPLRFLAQRILIHRPNILYPATGVVAGKTRSRCAHRSRFTHDAVFRFPRRPLSGNPVNGGKEAVRLTPARTYPHLGLGAVCAKAHSLFVHAAA